MVRSVPRPFTSMAPPSSTTAPPLVDRAAAAPGRAPSPRARRPGRPSCQSGYLRPAVEAEARDRHLGLGRARGARRSGPKSRVQPRSVGKRKNSTRPRSAPTRSRTRRAFASCAFDGHEDADHLALGAACARSRRRPTGWARTCPASPSGCAASRARWPRAAPTPPACGRPGRRGRGRGSPSALLPVDVPLVDPGVGVDAAVAQERPVRRTSSMRGRSTSPTRISSRSVEASAITTPNGSARNDEPQNSSPSPPSARDLVADAVDGRDVDAVRDRVRALDGLPGLALGGAVLRLLARVPADGGRVEEDGRAPQRGEPRGLRVPLVPADEGADAARASVEGLEAEVAGREVELLVEERVVGDVHLAVEARRPRRRRRG